MKTGIWVTQFPSKFLGHQILEMNSNFINFIPMFSKIEPEVLDYLTVKLLKMDAFLVSSGPLFTTIKVLIPLFFAVEVGIIHYLGILQMSADFFSDNTKILSHGDTFDYIIVGGGTAGCLLAKRLSENPENSVLLLEQGGDPSPLSQIPILSASIELIETPPVVLVYKTTQQLHACGVSQGICLLFSGYGLGGLSNINALVTTRGSPQIFNTWAQITRDERWKFENVLPFFKKFEDYHGYYQNPLNATYHTTGGELYVSNTDRNATTPALDYFFEAAAAAGLRLIDINNGDEARTGGYTHFDFYIKEGQRWSTYKAFLEPILPRPNLFVHRYATVTRVHLNTQRRATSVSFTKHGQSHIVHARKEIILSAGVFGSPKILLLSGIGPTADLQNVGIVPRIDLPVGKTLLDHVGVPLVYTINKRLFFYPQRDTTLNDIYQYVTTQTGNWANLMSAFGGIFTKSSIARLNRSSYPDLEFTYGRQYRAVPPLNQPNKDFFQAFTFLIAPKSVGNLKLRSSDPLDDLLINTNYLTAPEDMDRITEGLAFMANLIETSSAFQSLGVQTTPQSACSAFQFRSRDYWRCAARYLGQSGGSHFVGTCPMGLDPQTAVLDSNLRVIGVRGLRVIDASVMPLIPNAHTTAPTLMIAEVGSSLILEENGILKSVSPLQRLRSPGNSRRLNFMDVTHDRNFHRNLEI